jgi:WD40 repeat protein
MHPNRPAVLYGLRYSPDGKRIIAGDYPGGVIQVWDAQTGKQLTKIDSGYGYRGTSDYFFIQPDWKTVLVSREKGKHSRFEKNHRKMIRWDYDGDVRSWDLATGELQVTYKHAPPRGITWMELAPDGRSFVTFEHLTGEAEERRKDSGSLWDVQSRQYLPLPAGSSPVPAYSPDSKTLAVPTFDEKRKVTGVSLVDVTTGSQKTHIPIIEEEAQRTGFIAFSPDGTLLVGQVRDELKTGQHWLKFWDSTSGREVTSFKGENKDYFIWMAFSPDSRTLAVTSAWRRQQCKVFLFDLSSRKLAKTILLGQKASAWRPTFSRDGKWLAVPTQVLPEDQGNLEPAAEDAPQPHIEIIDVAAGEVRETLVSPPAFAASVCFSPDCKTLLTSGNGRVLVWDLTNPPLVSDTRRE